MAIKSGKSIVIRLALIFIMITLPLFALFAAFYKESVSLLEKNTVDAIKAHQQSYLNALDSEISDVRQLVFLSLSNKEWNLLADSNNSVSNYATINRINTMIQHLRIILNVCPYISDVRAQIPSIQKGISARRGLIEFDRQEYKDARLPLEEKNAGMIIANNKAYIPARYKSGLEPIVNIVPEVNLSQVALSLEKLVLHEGESVMLISGKGDLIVDYPSGSAQQHISSIGPLSQIGEISSYSNGDEDYLLINTASHHLDMKLVSKIPTLQIYRPLRRFYYLMWAFATVSAAIITIYLLSLVRILKKPLDTMVNAFSKIEDGDFSVRIRRGIDDEFAFLFDSFDRMSKNLEKLINENYLKEILVQKANYRQLQSQINPHFLYNSFFALHRMIKLEDIENAEAFAVKLGRYFKYITRNAADDVALAQEIEHARDYTGIMAQRYGHKVNINFGILPPVFENIMVPRLIIQPLIENCFEHGIKNTDVKNEIFISFMIDGRVLEIAVGDNGIGMTSYELQHLNGILNGTVQSEDTAILNIHKRFKIKYGESYGLTIESRESCGCVFKLRLPVGGDGQNVQDIACG